MKLKWLAVLVMCSSWQPKLASYLGKQYSEFTQRLPCDKSAPLYGRLGLKRLRLRQCDPEIAVVDNGMSRNARKELLRGEELRRDQTPVDKFDARIALLILGTYEGFPHECQSVLKELACLPCDGDIVSLVSLSQGTGFRRGVCPQVCHKLHQACAEAYFYREVSSTTNRELSACRKDSLVCAKLKDTSGSAEETCRMFGLQLNPKHARDEDFELRILHKLNISDAQVKQEAVCHDLKSSYQLYGRSKLVERKTQGSRLLASWAAGLVLWVLGLGL